MIRLLPGFAGQFSTIWYEVNQAQSSIVAELNGFNAPVIPSYAVGTIE
jgi:hypothetical protein